MQLSKVFWENESVLALNKILKVPIHFQFFFQCQNTPKKNDSIAHNSASSVQLHISRIENKIYNSAIIFRKSTIFVNLHAILKNSNKMLRFNCDCSLDSDYID